MLTVLTIPTKSNAGYYRDCRIYDCIDKGRVNNYGEKRCPNGYRVNDSGSCQLK